MLYWIGLSHSKEVIPYLNWKCTQIQSDLKKKKKRIELITGIIGENRYPLNAIKITIIQRIHWTEVPIILS